MPGIKGLTYQIVTSFFGVFHLLFKEILPFFKSGLKSLTRQKIIRHVNELMKVEKKEIIIFYFQESQTSFLHIHEPLFSFSFVQSETSYPILKQKIISCRIFRFSGNQEECFETESSRFFSDLPLFRGLNIKSLIV